MNVTAIKTGVFKEGENLADFVIRYIRNVKKDSVIVITSKIVALSENRTVIIENKKTKERVIRSESELAISTKHVWLTVKDGMIMASAGIDESNANGKLILLPQNSFRAALKLRKELMKIYNVKKLGVLITDSRTMPLRSGVTGVALGYAGFKGLRDYRGTRDIFGRAFKFSQTNVADSLAASAVFLMGEGNEQRPLAIIEKSNIQFCEKVSRKELTISLRDDMYRPLFSLISRKTLDNRKQECYYYRKSTVQNRNERNDK
ncbi:MAG TPA: coenzyme F420-0:L-glutamate ligase [Candidatus Paceibacterota bacterium]